MNRYDQYAYFEMGKWQHQMKKSPGVMNTLAKKVQDRLNRIIPEKVHAGITTAIKQMVRLVLFGASFKLPKANTAASLEEKEAEILKRISIYKKTAAAEGGITGAGGILMGLADFPLLLGIKIKLLFDIAALYGFDVKDYKERVYLLYIFQLAFSSHETRREVYFKLEDWPALSSQLPDDINQFDWRTFQQEYRDYIDLAKMAQLIPVIGAPVGAVVNYRLITKLGKTAMSAYRMRIFSQKALTGNEPYLLNN